MAPSLKLFSVLFIVFFAKQAFGIGGCGPSSIKIQLAKTGKLVEQKPEYEVSITNTCLCPQSKIIINCRDLSSVEVYDKNVIKVIDEVQCLINNGQPIPSGQSVKFRYAWSTPQDFSVVSTVSSCTRKLGVIFRTAEGYGCPPMPFPPGCKCTWTIDSFNCKNSQCNQFCAKHYFGGHGHCTDGNNCLCTEPCHSAD